MIVVVTGGRGYANEEKVNNTLDAIHDGKNIEAIIEGGAKGADTLCRQWARANGVAVRTFHAQWTRYGKQAGYLRNEKMASQKWDCAVVFPGGSGTRNMYERILAYAPINNAKIIVVT